MANELTFLVTIVCAFGYVLLSFLLGRRWLYAAIVTNLVLIGIFGAKLIALFGGITNVGNIFYVAVFFVGQLLVEHHGKKEARKSIWIGFAALVFFGLMGQLTNVFVPILESQEAAGTLDRLLGFAPRVMMASLIAYVCSQSLNIQVYSFLSRIRPGQIWLRSLGANAAGQALDSAIFFSVAFWGVIPGSALLDTAVTGFMVKTLVGAASIPLIYLTYRFKTRKDILEEEYEAILAGIGEGIVVTDRHENIMMVNKTFEELMGWKMDEVIGKKMPDILVREDEAGNTVPYKERILTQVLEGQKISSSMINHTYFRRKNGSRFPVKITVTPIRIDHKIMGAVELFSDVSAETQLEHMRRDFLSLASHQLRTPLSSTRWIIDTLLSGVVGKATGKQKKYLEQLSQVNSQMIKLATDTLDILHLESGAVPIEKKEFMVSQLYQEVMKALAPAAKENGVTWELGSGTALKVNTDFGLVRNIIQCFVANAITYSSSGKNVVLDCAEASDKIILSVKDHGIGIPADEQRKIFERFYRASNAKAVRVDGTGLGLSISQMIAHKLGATITFQSEENKGSTFSLHLPKP